MGQIWFPYQIRRIHGDFILHKQVNIFLCHFLRTNYEMIVKDVVFYNIATKYSLYHVDPVQWALKQKIHVVWPCTLFLCWIHCYQSLDKNKNLTKWGIHWFVSEAWITCHQPGWVWWKERCKMQHVLRKSLTRAEIDASGKTAQWAVTCELRHCPHAFCYMTVHPLSPRLIYKVWHGTI